MYSNLVLLSLLGILIPVRTFEETLGYNGMMNNVQNMKALQSVIQKEPNTLETVADHIVRTVNLQHIIRVHKDQFLHGETHFLNFNDTTKIPVYNETTDIPVSSSTNSEQTTPEVSSVTPNTSFPVSEQCLEHVEGVINGLQQKQKWAIKMIDAVGKPPSDILDGNLLWIGDYEECLSVKDVSVVVSGDQLSSFGGQYCLVNIPIKAATSLFVPNPAIHIAICLPDSCSEMDTLNLINSVLMYGSNNSIEAFSALCQEPDKPYDTRATIVLVVVSIFIVIMVMGTLYDVVLIQWPNWRLEGRLSEMNGDLIVEANEKVALIGKKFPKEHGTTPGMFGKILLAFSIYTNGSKLLSTDQQSGSITAIHGIRFLSMTWVILGHSISFVGPISDNLMAYFPRMMKRITFFAIANALVSVDTFFTLSGILLAYLVMKELKKKEGKINWGMFYFHRFWRLTPPYMLVLMVYVSLFPYIGSGPFWPKNGVEPNYCKNSWYYNILYVNNFVTNQEDSCFGWAWYLANDMQFFVISPLILLPLFYFHAAGVGVILAFLLGTLTATGVMSTKWESPMTIFDSGDYMKLYVRPYFRMGPYLMGLYTGYLLYRTNCKYRINKFLNLIGWIVAAVAACLVLYGPYNEVNYSHASTEISSLYNTVHRTVWGACVCWVVFSCANGYGGFVNTILSWKGLIPLSRLTYCAYLVHPIVIYHYQYTQQRLIHFTDISMIYQFLAVLVIAYGIAFVTSLAFESPMMGLEKVIFKREQKKK